MPFREPQRKTDPMAASARASRSGATWLALAAVFLVGAVAGWGGARFASGSHANEPHSNASLEAPADETPPDATLKDRMLGLDPFVVNLLGDDAARYLKVRVELEAETPAARTELETHLPQIRDGVISVLSARDVADVTSFEGKTLLKQDIQDRVNGLLKAGGVRAVLFTEFVVQ
jgi:flagellar FliL protein